MTRGHQFVHIHTPPVKNDPIASHLLQSCPHPHLVAATFIPIVTTLKMIITLHFSSVFSLQHFVRCWLVIAVLRWTGSVHYRVTLCSENSLFFFCTFSEFVRVIPVNESCNISFVRKRCRNISKDWVVMINVHLFVILIVAKPVF